MRTSLSTADGCRRAAILLLWLPIFACAPPRPDVRELPPESVSCWTSMSRVHDVEPGPGGLVWCATPGGVAALNPSSGSWKTFTVADGLPSNRVHAILSTSFGQLWVGTDRGTAFLDGRQRFTAHPAGGLPSPVVTVLAQTPGGAMLAGTPKGAALFGPGGWEPMDDTHEFARRAVSDLAVTTTGDIWVAKENSLSHRRRDGSWETFQKNILRPDPRMGLVSNSLLSLAVTPSGVVWIGTKMGLSRHDGRSWETHQYQERLSLGGTLRDNWIEDMAWAPDGSLWVAHGHSRDFDEPVGVGVYRENGAWTYLDGSDGLPSGAVYSLAPDRSGAMWLGTARGVARVSDGTVDSWRPPNRLPDNHVVSLHPHGPDGILAVLGSGVVLIGEGETTDLGSPITGGLSGAATGGGATAVHGTREGLFWLIEGERWIRDPFFGDSRIVSLASDSAGGFLAVTREGVYTGGPGGWTELPLTGAPGEFRPLKADRLPDGSLGVTGWMGRVNGGPRSAVILVPPRGEELVEVPRNALPYASLNHFVPGAPLLASPAGLYRLNNGSWVEERLPLPRGALASAAVDERGRLWLGGRDGGLYLRANRSWEEVRIQGRRVPGCLTHLLPRGDVVWAGTADQGIVRLELPAADHRQP